MSDEKPKAPPGGPPKLDRVPVGYKPPAGVRPPAPGPASAPPAPAAPPPGPAPTSPPASGAPPQVVRPPPPSAPTVAPGASYGIAAREVGADAALAAGIAHRGSLAQETTLQLFGLAAALQASGRLTLTHGAGSFALTFRRGTVEHAASSDPADDLGAFLIRKGALGDDQRRQAEEAKAGLGGDLAAALVAGRILNPADVATHLQEHGTLLVERALAIEAGGWEWTPGAAPPPSAFPLGHPFTMLCQAVRSLDATAVLRRLGDREHRIASRIGGRIRIEDLRLTPQETRAASLFDGARSPAEIASASPADTILVLRLALLLAEVGLLAFGASRKGAGDARTKAPAVAPGPRPAPPPRPGAPSARPAVTPPPAAAPRRPAAPPSATPVPRPAVAPAPASRPPAPLEKAALEALRDRLASADHFEVLGVKREATGAQIKVAYFQLAKTYHPDAVPVDASPEIRKLCADVFAKVSGAWSTLGEDAPRAKYLEELKSGGAADVDVMKILHAENLFQEGTLLVKSRNYSGGLKKIDEAIRLNPDEAEFAMWKAWCEFLLSDDKKRTLAQATGAIDAALKRNPNCAQGYLFLAQMAKVAGDLGLAERQLRRGLQVAPEHPEMQRELRYLRK